MERGDIERRVYEMCRRSPHGSYLMVTAFVQALRSYRCSSVCTPFPTALFHTAGDVKDKDYQAAEGAVQKFPAIDLISSSDSPREVDANEISNYFNQIQAMPLESLNLLYWLLHPRYQLELVQNPAEELSVVLPLRAHNGCQGNDFHILSSPDYIMRVQKVRPKNGEDLQTEFETTKMSLGSIFAFHGTSAENLHSILRCGLLNLSNTTLQRNGAIFGEGTYFSTDINVALTFSKAKEGWKDSCFGKNLKYLLVCEIAKGEKVFYTDKGGQSLIKASNSSGPADGSYIVVQNSDLIRIRYIFVYAETRVQYENKVSARTDNSDTRACERLLGRKDWCRILIWLYVGLLLGVAYLK
uniref:Poly [ADP-ribose] polymerase n=1 Tax=Araucaria cunninghamii TaxID=56994 RepID=A0A0D6QXU5_ARACU